jgi:hypothetical protein
MPVPVMDVGVVRVPVSQHLVSMRMRMWFVAGPREVVLVPVVLVVSMVMRVLEGFVSVHVLVPFAHVQPDAESHQHGGRPEQC